MMLAKITYIILHSHIFVLYRSTYLDTSFFSKSRSVVMDFSTLYFIIIIHSFLLCIVTQRVYLFGKHFFFQRLLILWRLPHTGALC